MLSYIVYILSDVYVIVCISYRMYILRCLICLMYILSLVIFVFLFINSNIAMVLRCLCLRVILLCIRAIFGKSTIYLWKYTLYLWNYTVNFALGWRKTHPAGISHRVCVQAHRRTSKGPTRGYLRRPSST